MKRLVSGHFWANQCWKDKKSHKFILVRLKAMSWADSGLLKKWLSFRAPSQSRKDRESHLFWNRVISSIARKKPC
jgi:hypothetical protein